MLGHNAHYLVLVLEKLFRATVCNEIVISLYSSPKCLPQVVCFCLNGFDVTFIGLNCSCVVRKVLSWHSSEVDHSKAWHSVACFCIGTMQLSPNLLKDDCPYLVVF